MGEVLWIKFYIDMFDKWKIKKIRRLPSGNDILLIWVMLLAMAGKCNARGMIYITESTPFTEEDLADELDFEVNTIRLALQVFVQYNMISITDDGTIFVVGWEEHQNTDRLAEIREYNRLAKQKSRAKQKQLESVNDKSMTSQRCHDTEEDIDKDKEKKEKKKKEIKTYSDDAELNQAILAFMEFRKSIKKPMTDRAVELLIKKLNGMTTYIPEQIEIINQSIVNGWQGVFPLKNEQAQPIRQTYHKQTKAEELNQFYAMAAQFGEGD